MLTHRAQVPGAVGAGVDGRRALLVLQVRRRQDACRDLQGGTEPLGQATSGAPTRHTPSAPNDSKLADAGRLAPAPACSGLQVHW